MSRIIVFGATGYTGELVTRSLVRSGAAPLLVARSRDRVAALAEELGGLDIAVADAGDASALAAVVGRNDVLVSTVGPFLKYGEAAVRVAAECGATYFDSTGEGPFIREVFERWGPVAAANGGALLSAFGFDFVPGSLVGALALEEAGPAATAVDVAYFVKDVGTSGGTRASIGGMMVEDAFALTGGTISAERAGRRIEQFDVHGRSLTGVSIPGAEHLALPASYPQLQDVGVFLGAPPAVARAMSVAGVASWPARRFGPAKALVGGAVGLVVKGSTGGPSAEQRARGRSFAVGIARDAAGRELSSVTLDGADPYDFTADILSWGARTAQEDGLDGVGGLGPVGAFGLERLTVGCAEAGFRRA
ncbi:saccharopine dehydrogenase family protein [Nocardioides caeni]|uniref:Saccharopine dehydrogenase n=1 Tax=Nocardioides caeni TaxID=574700 RepID=A0A4S8NF40_9ACTN|nr:saccharopine dehydrogenase NADP-binding domain-containing protein [Nocardioides caeni]THV14602.1 saccharopine dehydrogenase [Nocardioides caeni]